ncbi:MAG: C25 family cysteine peptidase, partial [Bacteroidota bacterium]
HSSAGVFDFNIDNPENYNNLNRYPLMMSLGCYSGNMFDDFRSIGERFLLLENKGAGAFAASRGVGFIHALGDFGKTFYQIMGTENYGGTIGEGIKATIKNYENFADLAYGSLNEQFSLQGDPAFRLNPAAGPDFTFEQGSAQFEPTIINAQKDSFSVTVNLYNLGQNITDSIAVMVVRELPSGITSPEVLTLKIPTFGYEEKLTFKLPTYGKEGIGLNKIKLFVNPLEGGNPITEWPSSATQNNEYLDNSGQKGASFVIIDNTALPVWPPEYALVGQQGLTLKASTADALAPVRKYIMEIDTTPYFMTPLERNEMSQLGGVINWKPEINYQDSTVYYWRISPDSLEIGTAGYVWEESSFTFITDVPSGWSQSHWGQYAENNLESLEVAPNEQLEYITSFRDLTIKNVIYNIGNAANNRPSGTVNGSIWTDFFRWNIRPSLQIVVIDTVGNFVRNENPGLYGSVNTSTPNPIAAFSFPVSTTAERENIINFLTDIIPDNHTVIVYNAIRSEDQDLWIQEWAADSITLEGKNIFNVLEIQGATRMRQLQEGSMRPYLFSYVKGGGGLTELLADDASETIFYTIDIPGRWTKGRMETQRIGPAQAWNSLEWDIEPQTDLDSIQLQLHGIALSGERIPLFNTEEQEGSWALNTISASDFPYLELDFYSEDRIDKTCADLAYWRILYQDLPDLALNANIAYNFASDTLEQGQDMSIEIAVSNVSQIPVMETLAEIRLNDTNQNEIRWDIPVPPLEAGEDFILSTGESTKNILGTSQLFVTINAADTPSERLRVNNQAIKDFYVRSDIITPVVSVSFDGESILDGDLVSSKPFINIQLTDENPYLLLNDTSLFILEWRDPLGNEQILSLNSPEVNFFPANSLEDNTAKIDWRPEFVQDGEYVLMIRGKDRAGNEARLWHETRFEVINEQMISNVLPYPNPFSTATRFVYTLTGDRPPTQYKLQIMTISGRIVREVQQEELGALRVGSHQTDFVWDGTDAYGDQLANGTYLYRFITENEEGESVKNYDDGTNRFFKNQLGKVVILR